MRLFASSFGKNSSRSRPTRSWSGSSFSPCSCRFRNGYALTTEVKNTTLTVVDKSNTPQAPRSYKIFRVIPFSSIPDNRPPNWTHGKNSIMAGAPRAYHSEGFMLDLERGNGATVACSSTARRQLLHRRGGIRAIHYHGLEPEISAEKTGALGVRIENVLPLSVRPVILFNPMLKSTWYMVPAWP